MTQATSQMMTIELADLQEFKSDKITSKPWADRGLYIVTSPIKNGFWSVSVTSTASLSTINPAVRNLSKFAEGFITLIRRTDRSFTEYETNWIEGLLFDALKNTDLDFSCSKTSLNPISFDKEKQAELQPVFEEILRELKDNKYDLEAAQHYTNPENGEPTMRNDTQTVVDFGGFMKVDLDYNSITGRLAVTVKDVSAEPQTVVSVSAVHHLKVNQAK